MGACIYSHMQAHGRISQQVRPATRFSFRLSLALFRLLHESGYSVPWTGIVLIDGLASCPLTDLHIYSTRGGDKISRIESWRIPSLGQFHLSSKAFIGCYNGLTLSIIQQEERGVKGGSIICMSAYAWIVRHQ